MFWAGGDGLENGGFDSVGVVVQAHVSQHHTRGQQQGGWVSQTLTGDVWGGTVDGFENADLLTHVTGRSQTQATDQTGRQVGQDVTVQVWHNHDDLAVGGWVGGQLQGGVVDQLEADLDVRVVLGDFLGALDEQPVGQLHDGGLVDNNDLVSTGGLGVLEGVSNDSLGGLLGDQLDRLDDTRDNDVLDTGVLTLGVFSDQDGVDVVVWGLVADNGLTWSDVGEKTKRSSQGQVHRLVTLTDRGGQRTLEGNLVLVDGVDGRLWDRGDTVDQRRGHVNRLPVDRDLGGIVDLHHGVGDLLTDTVTLDQGDVVSAVGVRCAEVLACHFGGVLSLGGHQEGFVDWNGSEHLDY